MEVRDGEGIGGKAVWMEGEGSGRRKVGENRKWKERMSQDGRERVSGLRE